MQTIRRQNPLLFDLILFLAFTIASFGAYFLADSGGTTGAIISIAILGALSIILVLSR